MKTKLASILAIAFAALASLANAQQKPPAPDDQEMEKIVHDLKYKKGEIDLQDGLAKLNVPPEFSYLDPEDAEKVLVKIWGNPPSQGKTLGMLMPAGVDPRADESWGVTITYSNDGYVKDDDAGKINYDKLLKELQSAIHDNNKARVDQGYPPMEMLGWAEPPRYDATTHKLYWAKELKVGDNTIHTLNYNIRILGRKGVLELNAIAGMNQLPEIEQNNPKILAMVNFNDGSRYADFDPKIDKVATYGIAGLIGLGIVVKLGLFKWLLLLIKPFWVAILAAKKLVIIGIAAIVGGIKKLFGKKQT